ncbi:MAG TPA: dihydroxyacetone kinase subunit L [Candidatus Flavonifractor merdigallinarum]|uniref:phosphoenolpyruvate--glycerone phosphotransferase n=1 Tax=Candidatus Flavonifractor merdigallinarum TaxID=2838589 RepID=A0A9D1Y9G4_9FIRM|nr:dihydroxyacetone kinase subunit L [Candidatus Flavonifractor merdigallinarum]
MKELNYGQVRAMLLRAADEIIQSKDLLTEIDSQIGDGDHGIGMERGMKKAKETLLSMETGENVYDLFQAMGKTMLMSMGGASGVIFGTLFLGGARNKPASATLDTAGMAALMSDSLAQIKERGKAQVGDKTMVDALEPAVEQMNALAPQGDWVEMMAQAAQAAQAGMEATKQYQAKYGRAKSLMERAIGHQDAGATSTWILLRAMADYVQSL